MHSCLKYVFDSYTTIEKTFLTLFSDWRLDVKEIKHRLIMLQEQSINIFQTSLDQYKKYLDVADACLCSLNPESILSRGYSIVYDKQGHVIEEARQVKVNDRLVIKPYKGHIISRVEKSSESSQEEKC